MRGASIEPSRAAKASTEHTRERILDAALEVLAEQSFGGLTLRKIAAGAGLSAPGLLRHFAGRDEILSELLARLVDQNEKWMSERAIDISKPADVVALARHNAENPGYVALFTMLTGSATNPSHPAHEFFRARYASTREMVGKAVERLAQDSGRSCGASGEAVRLVAGWDGLQLQSLYDDRIVVAEVLSRHVSRLRGVPVDREQPAVLPLEQDAYVNEAVSDAYGYSVGRDRRAEIVERATQLFAREGYHGVSLREVADELEMPKSSLLHHFPSKETLLQAVLAHRDLTILPSDVSRPESARAELLALVDRAQESVEKPGLIALYAVLSGEGVAPKHPAHDYFARRVRRVRGYLADLLLRIDGESSLRPGLDPVHEATWLVALWDGLQLQWLYDPDSVDLGAHLGDHVLTLLV